VVPAKERRYSDCSPPPIFTHSFSDSLSYLLSDLFSDSFIKLYIFIQNKMKFTLSAVVSVLAVSTSSAFTPIRNPSRTAVASSSTSLDYSVGIVGATGAVGKEIRNCLEDRGKLQVDELRIFGSARSAGTTVATKYGDVEVELFSVDAARACDVVFLAVDGDFALEHAKNICKGDDGAVVIDNSVCNFSSASACV
jgi:hypothetical protein